MSATPTMSATPHTGQQVAPTAIRAGGSACPPGTSDEGRTGDADACCHGTGTPRGNDRPGQTGGQDRFQAARADGILAAAGQRSAIGGSHDGSAYYRVLA